MAEDLIHESQGMVAQRDAIALANAKFAMLASCLAGIAVEIIETGRKSGFALEPTELG